MKIFLTVLILFLSAPAFAVREYYSISRSIRSLGMGGAMYGLSDDDSALFYNPAGLAHVRTEGEVLLGITAQAAPPIFSAITALSNAGGSSVASVVTNVEQFTGKPLYANANVFPHYLHKHFAVGLLLADTKIDLAILGSNFATNVDVTAMSDTGLVVGYGDTLFDPNWAIGINAKAIYRVGGQKTFTVLDLAQDNQFISSLSDLGGAGGGIDFDLGTTYQLPYSPLGIVSRISLSLNNLLASQFTIARKDGAPPALPRTGSLGGYVAFPGYGIIDNFQVLLDLAEFNLGGQANGDLGATGGAFFKHVNFGAEVPIDGWFTVRAGFHQGYLTAGLGFNFQVVKLDVATYAEELSSSPGLLSSRRVALRLQIGVGAPPPPPITYQSVAAELEEGGGLKAHPQNGRPPIPVQIQQIPQTPSPNGAASPGVPVGVPTPAAGGAPVVRDAQSLRGGSAPSSRRRPGN